MDEVTEIAKAPGKKSVSLTEQAYQYVRSLILAQELKPGEVFTERALADQLNASRTPMRAAINRLVGEELVERLSNGTIVIKQVAIEELMDILIIRRMLEGEAAAQAAQRHIPHSVDGILQKSREVAANPEMDLEPFWKYDDEFHEFVANASGRPILKQYVQNIRQRARMCHVVRMEKNFENQAIEHIAVLEAIAAGDAAKAREAMEAHVDGVKDRFVRWYFA
ncbi:GntR family transcriptional regulator [Neorhizobium alkalisoli]|uniref:GntR family transcriptional regulator n=1 Tax=Neorhizobium alkalisoli TaxID=528178 RepID=A0A561QGF4_9HYPH|nr:GntR family transcriptional regulator [Neorhizobium alkalisoli]TWF49434.1 GntR family transcriptional regulator [Neorhizobium alkalisoli]